MLLDTLKAFAVLEHFGVRVARAKVVDSAEDAIAFAGRRDAADDRAVPIVLRTAGTATGALGRHDAIRTAYARLAATLPEGGRIVAEIALPAGTDLVIEGRTTEDLGKVVVVRNTVHSMQRMVPLDEAGAELLATHVQGYGHRPHSDQTRRMLQHLLLRLSDLFEETGAESFHLTVRLHENTYTVADATMSAPRKIALKERLAHHAHDRMGYDYHPSGRQ